MKFETYVNLAGLLQCAPALVRSKICQTIIKCRERELEHVRLPSDLDLEESRARVWKKLCEQIDELNG